MSSSELQSVDLDLADEISKFYADPLGFVMFAFPWESNPAIQIVELKKPYSDRFDCRFGPDVWACEFLDSVGKQVAERSFDGRHAVKPIREAISSGHGIGKSAMTGWLVSWIMSTRPYAQGTVTANTGPQLETKTWAQICKWVKMSITAHWFDITSGRGSMRMSHKIFKDSWFCSAQTCREENSESFAGQHAANSTSFYINDEASAIPPVVWEVEEGGLSDGEPMIFAFGNPTKNSGKFRECFGKQKHRWNTRHIDSRDVQITNKKKIAEDVNDYGEDSDFIRIRVRGVFPRASSTQFVSGDIVSSASKREVPSDTGASVIIGVDVARFGDDQSVIWTRIGRDAKTVKPLKFRELDTMDLASRVIDHAQKYNVDMIFIDGGGVGGGVVDRVKQLGFNVVEVNFGGKPDDQKKFNNKAAEMWYRMREWLETGAIPDDPELYEELTSREYSFDKDGKIQLEKKSDMKKRGLASPDNADALALTFSHNVARKDLAKLGRGRMMNRTAQTDYAVFG